MNAAALIIRNEIEKRGAISFAHFMSLALYAHETGYYEKPQPIGCEGDFFTSASTGPLFGELLGFQFGQWIEAGRSRHIVETGAHDGQLAADVLGYLHHNQPELAGKIEYWIIEPSDVRKGWQRDKLKGFGRQVKWKTGWNDVKQHGVQGVIFGNELMDAFPVHRLGWDKNQQEW